MCDNVIQLSLDVKSLRIFLFFGGGNLKSQKLSIRISEEDLVMIDYICQRIEGNKSHVVIEALRRYAHIRGYREKKTDPCVECADKGKMVCPKFHKMA